MVRLNDVMEAIRIVDINTFSATELASVYDEILVPSFRPAELEPRENLLEALRSDESPTGGLVAVDPAGAIFGTVIGEWFADCRVMLLSYLAVRPELRGRGTGGRLVSDAFNLWRAQFTPVLVVAEAEDPRHYTKPDARGFGDAAARLRLYGRLGARILPVPYFQPAISRLQPRVRNMLLMVFDPDPSIMKGNSVIDARVVSCFVEENIARSEGRADDDETASLRAALRSDTGIPLHPMTGYLK
jgi:GNAT superfamily N-acetyltransferase